MMTKLLVLLLGVAVPITLVAPQPTIPLDLIINGLLDNITDPLTPDHPLELHLDEPGVMQINLVANDTTITGVGNFASSGSSVTTSDEADDSVYIKIESPQVTLNIGHYTIDGNLVGNIDLVGDGPGWITVDDMVVILEGTGTVDVNLTELDVTAEFTSAKIDLEMWRWTVNLEGIMPGTDLGTTFNEFFSMCGPEIFDTIENNINNSGKLLEFLNNLFSPPAAIKGPEA